MFIVVSINLLCMTDYCAQASSILDDDDEGVTPIIIPTTSVKSKPPASSSSSLSSATAAAAATQLSTDADVQPKPASAIDITADDILPRLTPPNVTDLVLLSMVCELLNLYFYLYIKL